MNAPTARHAATRWGFALIPVGGGIDVGPHVPDVVVARTACDAEIALYRRTSAYTAPGVTLIARPIGGWWWIRVEGSGQSRPGEESTTGLTWARAAEIARDVHRAGRTAKIGRCFPYGWSRPDGTVIRFRDPESIQRGEREIP